jgi:hypothetical protein
MMRSRIDQIDEADDDDDLQYPPIAVERKERDNGWQWVDDDGDDDDVDAAIMMMMMMMMMWIVGDGRLSTHHDANWSWSRREKQNVKCFKTKNKGVVRIITVTIMKSKAALSSISQQVQHVSMSMHVNQCEHDARLRARS